MTTSIAAFTRIAKFPLLLVGTTCSGLLGQTYENVVLQKYYQVRQTSAFSAEGISATPYGFTAFVMGQNIGGITAPVFTAASGSAIGGGSLVYNSTDEEWQYDRAYASDAAMLADLADGDYTFLVGGATLTLNLSGSAYANTPLFSFNQGYWSEGSYYFDPGQDLVLTSNTFSAYGANLDGMMSIYLGSEALSEEQEPRRFFSSSPSPANISLTLAASSVVGGSILDAELEFTSIVGSDTDPALEGVLIGAVYSSFSKVRLVAIPESSSFATLAAAATLGFAALARRRRRV